MYPAKKPIVTASPAPTFDGLFYKRLQHIERVLDEDPLELEKFKNYFNSVTKRQDEVKPVGNLLLLSNHKDYNIS